LTTPSKNGKVSLQKGGTKPMPTLKEEAIRSLNDLPDNADMETMMYRLYVLSEIKKGQEDIINGNTISHEDLKKESQRW
jgi:hypothetical protein